MEDGNEKKPKRVRPKKKGIRQEIRKKIEEALLANNSEVIGLVEPGFDGDLRASLTDVLARLSLEHKEKMESLTTEQLKSIANLSNLFEIQGEVREKLSVILKNEAKENLEEKMVYVDNLPPSCSADQLKKRANVFGNVVQVVLPQVDKMKRRCCPGMDFSINSGYGFIQFTSKIAARRFCKAYFVNSHLNRGHHHRKKKMENKDKSQPESDNETAVSKLLEEAQAITTTRRKRRCTEISTSEMSGDSGGEGDVPAKKAKTDPADPNKDKKKKKKRKRRLNMTLPKMTLATFFSRIQAFSYRRYIKLKKEYLELKKNSENDLYSILNPQACNESEKPDENKPTLMACGKKTKKLMETAAKVKNASFDIFRQNNGDAG
ncbi:unnamed protein product [Bursaphelenchus okinawaensis]|uniref:RRM domain-containing protein n=1 Tax=Bursaphelenchus okinawaensis TaxID=465554 RepID=A0A811KWK0_9BILA|nr:unnamed protein product [Bursaphelenchus okinawaensis]CAG9112914.1 unnamed protein product [Bursaphelenchus okinawaensis]